MGAKGRPDFQKHPLTSLTHLAILMVAPPPAVAIVDMTIDEAFDGEDDDSVFERKEFARDTLACSPLPPDSASDKRQSRGRRNHVTGVLDEMRTSHLETKLYSDARLKLSADMCRVQLNASTRIADAFAMLASANSGGGANTNGAGTVTTAAEAVKRLRCLLETPLHSLCPRGYSTGPVHICPATRVCRGQHCEGIPYPIGSVQLSSTHLC